ncbi:hypothetical protein SAMN04487995_6033 [Dyadobacter koreensis]|uniref:Uncharacterized protein n=1 Tax=Dyadobacter koreensis TaxID=408657 RepID=A0A1H7AZM2_9BACT|nr:hypothetical protein [Dyadobacter koreensis]SEJ71061.1 hypothetical protein SAMN04487995_6033 [Dyadobacter koreensis]
MSKPFFSQKVLNIAAILVFPASLIGSYLKAYYNNNILYSLSICFGIFWSAVILYWLKKSEQFWYGILEVLIGSITLIYSVYLYSLKHDWDETTLDESLKRAALIYLMVRGLGNIDEGVKKEFWLQIWIKPYWQKIKRFLFDERL